ncbi:hypothetical protein [Aeromicrobium sp. HA]|uniref:hypothetical protein n=1 Tax=Aeromicrobium sp. HA TaxID=3009077 RepID=UPI0022AEA521|nr:hypothetical protein [Aeromicrobium sp. HA]
MRQVDVFGAGLLASAVAGALCSLGFLLMGGDAELWGTEGLVGLLGVWLGVVVWYGLAAGLVLGIVPAAVAMNAWPALVRSVGEVRAVRCLTVLVTAIACAELLVAAGGVSVGGPSAILLVLGGTTVCGVVAWLHLIGARRIAHRRLDGWSRA